MYKNSYHIWNKYTQQTKEINKYSVVYFSNDIIKTHPNELSYKFNMNLGDKYNLIQLRYLKYNSYKKMNNKVLVNLDYLQHSDKNKKKFLNFISKKYNLKSKTYNPVEEYKGGQGQENFRSKNFKKPNYPQINLSKLVDYNQEIEEKINNLTFE